MTINTFAFNEVMAKSGKEIFNDYDAFVEKFKPKKTTDDCYTPQPVYDAIAKWVRANVPALASASTWLRPFYPGGNYEAEVYPADCAVVDNPPFSILSQIVKFYLNRGIKFWLFCPAMTATNYLRYDGLTITLIDDNIIFENGAIIKCGFMTNCWPTDAKIVINHSLSNAVKDAMPEQFPQKSKKRVNLPANVTTTSRIYKLAKYFDLEIPSDSIKFFNKLDCGYPFYGGGMFLSDGMAAELKAAELRATECLHLSDRERQIIAELSDVPVKYRKDPSTLQNDD